MRTEGAFLSTGSSSHVHSYKTGKIAKRDGHLWLNHKQLGKLAGKPAASLPPCSLPSIFGEKNIEFS